MKLSIFKSLVRRNVFASANAASVRLTARRAARWGLGLLVLVGGWFVGVVDASELIAVETWTTAAQGGNGVTMSMGAT